MPQLKAQWINTETIRIFSGVYSNDVIAIIPVKRVNPSQDLIKPMGNVKTHSVIGMLNSCSGGCFRGATGFDKCGLPCYADAEGKGGCYANSTVYATFRRKSGYDVIYNGIFPRNASYFALKLPKHSYSLSAYKTKIWRVDSETSDLSLSMALGIAQKWAAANPDKKFTGISSNYFFVPNEQLREAASLRNFVAGHTLSGWFGEDDLENRVRAIKRFLAFGVPSVVWIATSPDYDNQKALDLALSLVPREQVIEVATHHRGVISPLSLMVNPLGSCCENLKDRNGNKVNPVDVTVEIEGEKAKPFGNIYGSCRGCKLLCGAKYLHEQNRLAA